MAVTARKWEDLFAQWNAALDASGVATDNEGAVEAFATQLLGLLGWDMANCAWKEKLSVRVGCEDRDLFPDLVIAPSKADTKKPGSVYAVIELKRRGLADEGARRQAQSYADALRAPVYAVIDGERIQVWHRRLVEADKKELDLPRAEFPKRFDEVRSLLGRAQLTRLHEDLRTRDEVDAARTRVANLDHDVKLVRLELRDGKIWCDHPAAVFLSAERWWGSPVRLDQAASPVRLEIFGAYDAWKFHARQLVEEIARLCKHGPAIRLAVEEQVDWQLDLDRVALNLERNREIEGRAQAGSCENPRVAGQDLGEPGAVASALATALDTWVFQAVTNATAEALQTGPWSAVADTLGTPEVDLGWLRSALRTSRADKAHAQQRLGPRSVKCLVDALLYSKAVVAVLPTLEVSAQPDFPHNLDCPGTAAKEGIGFTYALAAVDSLEPDAYLLLLSGSSCTHLAVPCRIGVPPRGPNEALRRAWRIGDENGQPRILCSLSDDARTCLNKGWDKFKDHLEQEIRAQKAFTEP